MFVSNAPGAVAAAVDPGPSSCAILRWITVIEMPHFWPGFSRFASGVLSLNRLWVDFAGKILFEF